MGLDGIPTALPALPALRPVAGRAPRGGDEGVLRFNHVETMGEDLLVDTEDGRRLRLAGGGQFEQDLSEGDMLLVRVRTASPELELEWLGSLARTAAAAPRLANRASDQPETAAMRLDQASLSRILWQDPTPETLANTWRALLIGHLAAPRPGESLLAAQAGLTPSASADLMSAVYAWRGVQLMLGFVPDREAGGRAAQPVPALRLEMKLPGLGHLVIELGWAAGGLALLLGAEGEDALEAIRGRLTALGARLARAGIKLGRCALYPQLAALARPRLLPAGGAQTSGLFLAAAEIVRELSRISPANR